MPYNKKPAGARPAKNNEARYSAKKSGPKAGSRSPGHRGYRADAEEAAPKKQRWNAEDRAARSGRPERSLNSSRGGSAARGERSSERPNWEPREKRSNWTPRRDSDDRAPRRDFTERAPRREYDDRAPRRDFSDRAPRTAGRVASERSAHAYRDRPRRDQDDRAPRREYDDRAPRSAGRVASERSEHAYRDRPRRDQDERTPRRSYDERAPRRDVDDRAPRRSYDERPPRRDRDDRPRTERRESNFYPSRPSTNSGTGAGSGTEGHRFTANDDVVLERLEADAIQASDVEGVTFGDLGLGGNIVRELVALGAEKPFPIQAATIPDVLAGKDVLGRGRTGSGKTIAFGAPLVERLMTIWAERGKSGGPSTSSGTGRTQGARRVMGRKPRALILAPTRELALQIDRTVQPIARSVGLFTTQIYGGVPQHRQVGALQRGVDIVIGTPGRIEDLIEQGRLDLSEVEITVLDEADHMCDLGFLEPVQRILRHTSDGGQKLLFSATLDKGVATLVDEFLVDPTVHEVAGEDQASSTIEHHVFVIEHRDKGAIIEQLTDRDGKTLVFARTRAFAEQLADQLDDAGIPAVSLHGDLNQSRRTRNLEKLTSGRVNVLVATDVAARGIHVDDIDLVIQADAPDEYKTYLHRSGRTGRAGKQGTVVTLIPRQRRRRMDDLLGRAEIEASFRPVIPGDQSITDLALSVTEQLS
jgi:Superfamily II DNA and RNA helicases